MLRCRPWAMLGTQAETSHAILHLTTSRRWVAKRGLGTGSCNQNSRVVQVSLCHTLHIGLGDLGDLLCFMIAEVIPQTIQLVECHIARYLVVGLPVQAGGDERHPFGVV